MLFPGGLLDLASIKLESQKARAHQLIHLLKTLRPTILNRFRSHDTSDESFAFCLIPVSSDRFQEASSMSAWNGEAEIRTQIKTFRGNFELFR